MVAVEDKIVETLNQYLSKVEVAADIRKDPRTLDRWFDLGIGPPVTLISGRRYYNKEKLSRWKRAQKLVRRAAATVRP